jgi:hypothetical protein
MLSESLGRGKHAYPVKDGKSMPPINILFFIYIPHPNL